MTFSYTAVLHIPNSREHEWRTRCSDMREGQRPIDDLREHVLMQTNTVADLEGVDRTGVLVLVPSPSDVVATAISRFGMSPLEAVRYASVKFAHAAECVASGARVASAELGDLKIEPTIGVAPDKAVCSSVPPAFLTSLAYFTPFPPRLGSGATIHSSLFLTRKEDQTNVPATFDIDMTGRRRILIFGPYLELPPGVWRAVIRFQLKKTDAVVSLRFEWASGEDGVRLERDLHDDGVYDVSLERAWASPGPCELRIWLDRSVFDASLVIEAVQLKMIG